MLRLSSEVTVGNILTSVTIIIGLSTFLYNEIQKREQVDRAYAAEVRHELGGVLREIAQMDAELRVLFLSIEPLYVTASEIALEGDDSQREQSLFKARDFLWREIANARAEMERRVLATSTQSNGLAIAGLNLQADYEDFIERHSKIRANSFSSLSSATQKALQATAGNADYSAQIGNALRNAHYDVERAAIEASEKAMRDIGENIRASATAYETSSD